MYIQGADDKLGQFLDQDIKASANHRNVLRHSLVSCPSLVSPNVNKPTLFSKMSRQRRKKLTRDCKVAKSAQVHGLLFLKKVLNQNQHAGEADAIPVQVQNEYKKCLWASHGQWILWPGHTKHSQNHPGVADAQPEGPLVQEIGLLAQN